MTKKFKGIVQDAQRVLCAQVNYVSTKYELYETSGPTQIVEDGDLSKITINRDPAHLPHTDWRIDPQKDLLVQSVQLWECERVKIDGTWYESEPQNALRAYVGRTANIDEVVDTIGSDIDNPQNQALGTETDRIHSYYKDEQKRLADSSGQDVVFVIGEAGVQGLYHANLSSLILDENFRCVSGKAPVLAAPLAQLGQEVQVRDETIRARILHDGSYGDVRPVQDRGLRKSDIPSPAEPVVDNPHTVYFAGYKFYDQQTVSLNGLELRSSEQNQQNTYFGDLIPISNLLATTSKALHVKSENPDFYESLSQGLAYLEQQKREGVTHYVELYSGGSGPLSPNDQVYDLDGNQIYPRPKTQNKPTNKQQPRP